MFLTDRNHIIDKDKKISSMEEEITNLQTTVNDLESMTVKMATLVARLGNNSETDDMNPKNISIPGISATNEVPHTQEEHNLEDNNGSIISGNSTINDNKKSLIDALRK